MNILLLGKSGQVGWELQRSLAVLGRVTALDHDSTEHCGDFANPEGVRETVRALRPDVIVNAAAHTAVDKAESEPEIARLLNATTPDVLAEEAARLGAWLIHYSTDYVFYGSGTRPWVQTDAPAPLSVYGATKLEGEGLIQQSGCRHLILRTSWVYSTHGKNFLLTMQRLLQERPELRVVADQIGAPTWAGTIARSTRLLIERWQAAEAGAWGVYHLTAQGETSWFGFTQAIAEPLIAAGKPCAALKPIPASDYPTPAARPQNSRLDCSRLGREWGVTQPDWRAALAECVAEQR